MIRPATSTCELHRYIRSSPISKATPERPVLLAPSAQLALKASLQTRHRMVVTTLGVMLPGKRLREAATLAYQERQLLDNLHRGPVQTQSKESTLQLMATF